ncbi:MULTISPECIES: chloride channel protein [Moorena]|uniref:Chloride channel protein EriC n=1 Tax=Moorena producens 3L TaxID=489825 RepID=F4Y370_9CYAN|nr:MULTISPECIES: chloride channel protein [Moorena]EGJ28546.1 chloride channel protein EriC [Moorena producens 3L]NEP67302.1 CBS domain-containing protein [Moorena sp. SIO3A5]OLT63657.1 chloride channel protein [Moorena producens 3L]
MINPITQWLIPKRSLALAEACLIGFVSGLSAVLLKHSIGWLGRWRLQAALILPPSFALPAFGLCLGLLCGFLIEFVASEATGSGVPQIKGALARFPIAMNLRVAVVKLVSTILSLAAGMTMGRQGPTVHIGAALAAQLTRWVPTSPDHRRQMIAAGAGAGLAAGFNAPLASVAFIFEELLPDLSSITLGSAILASFIGAVVSRLLGGGTLDLNRELSNFSSTFSALEIPFYLLLGVLAGLLAALFNQGILSSLNFYDRLKLSLPLRIGIAGMLGGCIVALLPDQFHNNSGLRELLLTGDIGWEFTCLAFVVYFLLTIIAYGSGAPGGLFHPSLVLGSALGYLVGIGEYHLLGLGYPITYALAGMGAFFSAVSKVPITAIVIVFEMTTDFNLVLPLMITCVVSYLVADQLAKGSLYQRLLERKGYSLPKVKVDKRTLAGLKASDIMQRRVETLGSQMTLDQAIQTFSNSSHRGFPVVAQGKLVGIITQEDIAKNRDRLPGNTPIKEVMTPQPITVRHNDTLSHVLYILNRYHLNRLPVLENRKLVGIITFSDIIRAEANQLSGEKEQLGPSPDPSYGVYYTRAPATGSGRMLVPLANPQSAPVLLEIATAIGQVQDYEIECLQVIPISRSNSPAQTGVDTTKSRRLLRQAERLGRRWEMPVHTQIRISHDTAQAILETIKQRHINLILMGWKGAPSNSSNQIFGNIIDTLIRQAPCDLVLLKLPQGKEVAQDVKSAKYGSLAKTWKRWLIPIAGGPNSSRALQLIPILATLAKAEQIVVTQVFNPQAGEPVMTSLEKATYFLKQQLKGMCDVVSIPIRSYSVSDALIRLANAHKYDVVVIGASREGLLEQAIHGNIPEAIARGVDSTVILVREALH